MSDLTVDHCHTSSTAHHPFDPHDDNLRGRRPQLDSLGNQTTLLLSPKRGSKPCHSCLLRIRSGKAVFLYYFLKTLLPKNTAFFPNCSSIRSNSLYFATRSVRQSDPVLICPHPSPTTKCEIVTSSVSPDL